MSSSLRRKFQRRTSQRARYAAESISPAKDRSAAGSSSGARRQLLPPEFVVGRFYDVTYDFHGITKTAKGKKVLEVTATDIRLQQIGYDWRIPLADITRRVEVQPPVPPKQWYDFPAGQRKMTYDGHDIYRCEENDTISSIAHKFSLDREDLLRINKPKYKNLKDPRDRLRANTIIYLRPIPSGGSVSDDSSEDDDTVPGLDDITHLRYSANGKWKIQYEDSDSEVDSDRNELETLLSKSNFWNLLKYHGIARATQAKRSILLLSRKRALQQSLRCARIARLAAVQTANSSSKFGLGKRTKGRMVTALTIFTSTIRRALTASMM